MVASSEQSPLSSLDTLDSEDAVIISDSPSRKRQRLDTEAKQLVESALTNKPGGERIINEYNRTKSLTDETRRKMVNMLAADMTEKNGTSPPRQVKEMYAKGIVTLFPYLSDPFSKNGYVEQDFVLMFGEDTSSKLLERWPVTFKKKIIKQCRKLPSTSELEELLLAADPPEDGTELDVDFGWDSDLSSVLLLLHLIPPSAQGRKRPGKVSASQAEKHLVVFEKTGTNIQEHLDAITTSAQPYLLAVGVKKNAIHQFFIIIDKNAIPCRPTSSLVAFDELFKAHFVFGTSYNTLLHNMYTFIQTTVYNIDAGKVKESRVAEVRARLLH
ncbi:uncharacterized protein LOC120559076 [Perca fluviatilis]|uniref:uncharacterized protein LOC120559076 n=1 Tax=Perca fluviatilis TaxID=8168 RepID=UPI0019659FEB|nr:uncharacterized protein LOC120559076 [Perca fluviatilis]